MPFGPGLASRADVDGEPLLTIHGSETTSLASAIAFFDRDPDGTPVSDHFEGEIGYSTVAREAS